MKGQAFAVLFGVALTTGCGRTDAGSAQPPDGGPKVVETSPPVEAGVPSDATGPAEATGPRSWSGTYRTSAGTLYVPDQLKVHWHPSDDASGLGDGPLTLVAEDSRGTIRGTVGGPLGPALLDGYLADGTVTATISRRDPNDQGFKGVLVGKIAGGHVEGTLNASPAAGGAVRVGTFTASAAVGAPEH